MFVGSAQHRSYHTFMNIINHISCYCSYDIFAKKENLKDEPSTWVSGVKMQCLHDQTWTEIVEKDCQAHGLNREDAMDHSRRKKQITDD